MPHIIIEYSANMDDVVDMADFCNVLRIVGIKTGIFPEPGIRVRAHRCDIYSLADGKLDAGFIDISVRLRGGRPLEVRKAATAELYAAAEKYLEPVFSTKPFVLSYEMRDIDPELSPKRSSIREYLIKGNESV